MTSVSALRPASGRAAEATAMLRLAWPIVLTNLAHMAIMTTDVVMMGQLGPAALAAGTLGANLFHALFVVTFGIANATAPMLAQGFGRREGIGAARRTVNEGFRATVVVVLPVWAVLWQAESVLLVLGQEPGLAALAGDYVRTLMWGLLPFGWFMVLRCFVSAIERPTAALVVTVAAVLLNIFSNWVLMFGNLGAPRLELAGAGISSTLVCAFMAAALWVLTRLDRGGMGRYRLLSGFWRIDWPRLAEVARLGWPIALTFGFEIGVFNVSAFMMGRFGAEALAAHAIVLQIAAVTFMVPFGIAQAATVRVGLAEGAGDRHAATRSGWTALAMAVAFMTMTAAVMLTLPGPLVGLFIDRGDPAAAGVLGVAMSLFVFAGLFQVFDGAQAAAAGALRGLKDTRVPMLIAGVGYWGVGASVAVVLAFATPLGPVGIWIGLVCGLAMAAILMVARWIWRTR